MNEDDSVDFFIDKAISTKTHDIAQSLRLTQHIME